MFDLLKKSFEQFRDKDKIKSALNFVKMFAKIMMLCLNADKRRMINNNVDIDNLIPFDNDCMFLSWTIVTLFIFMTVNFLKAEFKFSK